MSKFRLASLAVFYLPSFFELEMQEMQKILRSLRSRSSLYQRVAIVKPFCAFGTFLPFVESLWNLFFDPFWFQSIISSNKNHSNFFRAAIAISSKISARFARRSFLIH